MNGLKTEKQSLGKQDLITCPPFGFVANFVSKGFLNALLKYVKTNFLIFFPCKNLPSYQLFCQYCKGVLFKS